jgi:transposase
LLKRKAKDTKGVVVVDERQLGRISILSNLDLGGEKVYGFYKEREMVEVAFDAMKNELEHDKCYLGDSDAVRGYFFVSFLCLYLYFRVLERLRVAGLVGEVSVEELLFCFLRFILLGMSMGKSG